MVIDIVFLILMILAIVKGYRKGFIVAAFSFVGIIIGLAAAMKLSAVLASSLKMHTHISVGWLPFLAFVLILLGVWILVRLGAAIVEASFKMAFLGWLNILGGILLYAVLYATVLSIVLFYAGKLDLLKPAGIEGSRTYIYLHPLGPKLMELFAKILPIFKGMFDELSSFFDGLGK